MRFRCGARSLAYFVILVAFVVVAAVWFVFGLPFGKGSRPAARAALAWAPPRKYHIRSFVCEFDKELLQVKMQHPEWSLHVANATQSRTSLPGVLLNVNLSMKLDNNLYSCLIA